MIICKACGTQNEPGATFCGSCGTFLEWHGEAIEPEAPSPLPPPVPPEPSRPIDPAPAPDPTAPEPTAADGIACPNCGAANERTRVYCRRCAAELVAAPAPVDPVVPEPPRPRSGPPLAVIGGIAAVILLGAAGAFVLLPRGAPTPSPGVTTAPPSTAIDVPSAPASDGAPPSDLPASGPPVTEPPASGPATVESLTGVLVFGSERDGNVDVWTWDPADDRLRRLVKGAGNQTEPAWSPDGTAVVYRAPDGLRMVLADGDPFDPPDFTHHRQDRNPTWSRDGSRVVFSTDRAPFATLDIVSRAADDNKADLVVLVDSKGEDWDPAFSPDGSRIAFVSTRQEAARIFLMDPDGTGEALLDLGDGVFDDPAFSPDGEWLAFTRRDEAGAQKDLWVARVNGSSMRRLTETEASEHDMVWSPDGRVIAVVRADDDGRIVLLDAGTGEAIGDIGVDGNRNVHPDWWWPRG